VFFTIYIYIYIYIFFVNYIEKSYVQDLLIFGPMRKDKFGDTDVYVRLILQSFIKNVWLQMSYYKVQRCNMVNTVINNGLHNTPKEFLDEMEQFSSSQG
jgi:hypothetical protein